MNKTQFALLICCLGLAASAHGMKKGPGVPTPVLDAFCEQFQEEQNRRFAVYARSDIATIEDRTQPLKKRLEALADLHTMFHHSLLPISYDRIITEYRQRLQQEQKQEQSVSHTVASASSAK